MNTSFEIIQARPEQVDVAAPLFDAYRQFYKQPSNLERARDFLRARLAREESLVYLAMRGGEAVGFMQLYPSFSSIALKRLWVLNDLYVVPAMRTHGVGAALLECAKDLARRTEARGIILSTATDNPAQRLYEQCGWRRDEQFYHYEWYL
jgi:GNAT superfamily N-acetyltransferase